VPCDVVNLPPGVRVVNLGLNGVLVAEDQTKGTFTLRAADWAKPIVQPIYVVARVESNSTTEHPSRLFSSGCKAKGMPAMTSRLQESILNTREGSRRRTRVPGPDRHSAG
jgi:hypothetical protein